MSNLYGGYIYLILSLYIYVDIYIFISKSISIFKCVGGVCQ